MQSGVESSGGQHSHGPGTRMGACCFPQGQPGRGAHHARAEMEGPLGQRLCPGRLREENPGPTICSDAL